MPGLPATFRSGGARIGGGIGYRLDQLYEEVAYVAYHFHWPHAELMALDHLERHKWLQEIAKINERINSNGDDDGQ
ncbi:DUF6760 family protein [Massilia sp. IC2-278]|uniref:DUF6760 family protein n=1 Tax=Massilia sp. IC2-278 TaxID=2887200 RepID=UPI0035A6E34B